MTENYVAYLRVSTDKQGRSGLGLEAQEKAILDYLDSREGRLLKQFIEIESGKKNDRPKLAEALAYCKKHRAVLLIARLDRLARSVAFISRLMESGVRFVASDMPGATDFMLHVYAAVAEEERRMISRRTKDALQAAKARGVELGKNGSALATKHKANAKEFALRMKPVLAEIQSEGHKTVRQVTAALNEKQIPSRGGGRWHLASVFKLLGRLNACN